ncbi:uncharacterized protein BDR25DRAFT_302783 [Lindgomyces ingoldianus]|uniref:Uncharacterized protein n=1 Tax=Lindgomyces ingoldianus TaxID=673940 RepID=A0ACB6QYI5_9PLEO|nr:uncharacterized protein BDR25DRAFT_302783 [Lindgomyces ingoldianus]KAF2471956.1 hypothetical protein BDR25DRAFT_302783 [Lindgomyces ingoldianus]
MNQSEVALHLQPALRTLQPAELQALHQSAPGALHHHLQTLAPSLQGLEAISHDASDGLFQQPRYHVGNPFESAQTPGPYQPVVSSGYQHDHGSNRFSLIAAAPAQQHQHQRLRAPPPPPPPAPPPPPPPPLPAAIPRVPPQIQAAGLEPQTEFAQALEPDDPPVTRQFEGLKLIAAPPNLDEWRAKLFHVDDTITLTENEFQTYFPHIDNVYSHRSTQRHKRKRFVSHYWDCRLKGRPPGTKKSTDPDKKKRKRVARERDLCDVKIKITEYFDGAELTEQTGQQPPVDTLHATAFFPQSQASAPAQVSPWGISTIAPPLALNQSAPAPPGKKFYTIQRVNGNGGNGKGDGVAGPHKHTLDESDRVKKNSVIRWVMKGEKDKKKVQGGAPQRKTYHKRATGNALVTVKNHSKEDDLKLFGSCFCPFVQRVWISLEFKSLPYQYIEVDPYKKPQSLLEINPRGLVPAIRHGPTWSTHESTVIMEYFEDLGTGPALLPPDPQARATCRLWTDHINRLIVPCFYRLLQAQDSGDQVNHATELRNEISKLVDAADPEGPFFFGRTLGFVDVQIAPWVLRLRRVLGPYRGWPEPEEGTRWARWTSAIEAEPSVKSTTSDEGLYWDSYERYAENRPNTSQLADAVNSGRGLP